MYSAGLVRSERYKDNASRYKPCIFPCIECGDLIALVVELAFTLCYGLSQPVLDRGSFWRGRC